MAVRPRGNTGSLQVREADLGVYRKRSEHLSQTRSILHGESQLLLCKPIVEVFGKWSQVVASGRKWSQVVASGQTASTSLGFVADDLWLHLRGCSIVRSFSLKSLKYDILGSSFELAIQTPALNLNESGQLHCTSLARYH